MIHKYINQYQHIKFTTDKLPFSISGYVSNEPSELFTDYVLIDSKYNPLVAFPELFGSVYGIDYGVYDNFSEFSIRHTGHRCNVFIDKKKNRKYILFRMNSYEKCNNCVMRNAINVISKKALDELIDKYGVKWINTKISTVSMDNRVCI